MKQMSLVFTSAIIRRIFQIGFFTLFLCLNSSIIFCQWSQLGQDLLGEGDYDQFGIGMSVSGDGSTIAAGSHQNSEDGMNRGHVRVFKNVGGTWLQQGPDIEGIADAEGIGLAVSLSYDGTIVAIGGYGNTINGVGSGLVRVYQFQGGSWVQIGSTILGETQVVYTGWSVSLSNDGATLAVSSLQSPAGTIARGRVRVYEYDGNDWIQIGSDMMGEADQDYSGNNIDLSNDGSTVAIGAFRNDAGGIDRGHVRVYRNFGGTWTQLGADIDGENDYDYSGYSVAMSSDGSIVAVGEYLNSGGGYYRGRVRTYKLIGSNWLQQGADILGEADEDYFGESVSLSADGLTLVSGAGGNSSLGMYRGQTRIYKFESGNWNPVGTSINGEEDLEAAGSRVSLSNDGSIVGSSALYSSAGGLVRGIVRAYHFIAMEDADCDGVADEEDLCLGGDDSVDNNNDGLPDCYYLPIYEDILPEWQCGNQKVWMAHFSGDGICHSICLSYNAAQSHLNHGDFLGTCDNAGCSRNASMPSLPINTSDIVHVHPNPTVDKLYVDFPGNIQSVSITSLDGQLVKVQYESIGNKIIDVRQLGPGLYFLWFQSGGVWYPMKFSKL